MKAWSNSRAIPSTTNIVTAGNPLVPIGDSDAENAGHLHLNTIPLNRDYSDGSTTWNGNPLQFIAYNKTVMRIRG